VNQNPLRIIDGHAHVASMRFIPSDFVGAVAANVAAPNKLRSGPAPTVRQVQSLVEAQYSDHNADRMVAAMNEAGVERTVLLLPDFTYTLKCDRTIAEMAELHHKIRLRHPGRFYVFQGVDPRTGREGVDFFERSINQYNFEGLKLYPPCGYSPSDPRLFPFYEICRERGLPVLLHTGPTSPVLDFELARPGLIDRAAREFSDVNFILAHGGVNYTEEAALLCAYRPNVFLDIAGFPSTLRPGGWKPHLKALFTLGINHKIIFGTDWPLNGLTMTLKSCIDELTMADGPMAALSRRECEGILGANIERLIPETARHPPQRTERSSQEALTCA
jgi:uncharacterized protein